MSLSKPFLVAGAVALAACGAAAAQSFGQGANPRASSCQGLPSAAALQSALKGAVGASGNGGFGLNMWATIVANDGTVCAVVYSGASYQSQWLASRVISAQKASTANGLSLSNGAPPQGAATGGKGFAISTANLYAAVQGGGSLYGLQFSNPVDPDVAYFNANGQPDNPNTFGTPYDPMVGRPVGGVNVFGGGLALYAPGGNKIGAVGVSGDTSCTDHYVSWRVRNALKLDHFDQLVLGPDNLVANAGLGLPDPAHPDNIIFDIAAPASPVQGAVGTSPGGWGHPTCAGAAQAAPSSLPAVRTSPSQQ